MKTLLRYLSTCVIGSVVTAILAISSVSAQRGIVVDVPPSNTQADLVTQDTVLWQQNSRVQADEGNIYTLIQTINQYLRYSIAVISFAILIYGWIRLMTASGDEKVTSESLRIIGGALIGIFIAIFSFTIVRLVVNLF